MREPVINPTLEQIATADRFGLDPRWVDSAGRVEWPPNQGFANAPETITLQKGMKIDRYGGRFVDGELEDQGSFVSPKGVSFEARSLPPSTLDRPYTVYDVIKPIPGVIPGVDSGLAAPWFGQPGGGLQFDLVVSIDELIENGFIVEAARN